MNIIMLLVLLLASSSVCQASTDCFVSTSYAEKTFYNNELSPTVVKGSSTQGCAKQYTQCESFEPASTNPAGDGFECNEVVRYNLVGATKSPTRSPSIIPAAVKCAPVTSQACQCQQSLDITVVQKLTYNFSLSYADCCCRCAGDPHCRSFFGETQDWIVCDNSRDPNSCSVMQSRCDQSKYTLLNNETYSCKFIPVGTGGACVPQGVQPLMNMYTKTYGVPSKTVSVTVGLSTMGSINMIRVEDDGVVTVLTTSTSMAQKTKIIAGWKNFADGLYINVIDQQPGTRYFARFDVEINDEGLTQAIDTSGFCPTGIIDEAAYEADKGCIPSDLFIFQRLFNIQSAGTANAANAKLRWCQRVFPEEWQACRSKPWFHTICLNLLKEPISYIPNPNNFPLDFVQCLNEFQDSPGNVINAYKTGLWHNDTAPLVCLPFQFDQNTPAQTGQYAYIEKARGNTWDALYSFSEMQVACGASFTLTGNSPTLMQPGTYRVLQCQSIPTTPSCSRYKAFAARIQYSGAPLDGPVLSELSTPLGLLDSMNQLGCTVPNCPTSLPPNSAKYYRCCMWTLFSPGWEQCMLNYGMLPAYGKAYFDANYPACSH